MDENRDDFSPPQNLCRMGCGFYGSDAFDGMCSKCHKDAVTRVQNSSPLGGCASVVPAPKEASPTISNPRIPSPPMEEEPKEQTSQPSAEDRLQQPPSTAQQPDVASPSPASPATGSAKKKKSKCQTCNKKVGLTGFSCRCGGLFCSQHRYSNEHGCQFDYQELGKEQLSKQNPKVVASKVEKIGE